MTQRRPLTTDVPFYPGPTYRPPPKPIRSSMEGSHEGSQSSNSAESTDIDTKINIDFEENSPFQEGVTLETYQRPNESFFQQPLELQSLVNAGNLLQKFLPKQANIDKILKVIQRNRLPSTKAVIRIVEILAERYVLLDSLLFKIYPTPEKETALLVIPEICTDKIITLYHSSLFAEYQGVIKTYLTINCKFLSQTLYII